MIQWGISAGSHDASLAVIEGRNILFASHSERYSGIKNDKNLNDAIIRAALEYGKPTEIHWYESWRLKSLRKFLAGQGIERFNPIDYLRQFESFIDVGTETIFSGDHHESHAAAGFYTSPYVDSAILVIDAIGEFTTTSIWHGQLGKMQKLWSQSYPNSLGLWYSAMTQRIGLRPNEEEYILMGMAAYGDPKKYYNEIKFDFFKETREPFKLKQNLHRGCKWWRPELQSEQDYFDIAAATQLIYEEIFERLVIKCRDLVPPSIYKKRRNLVIMGGCALNCKANSIAFKYYANVWIMPNPGDAGSSIGAVAAHNKVRLRWVTPYLGHNITGAYPVEQLLNELRTTGIVGVANGGAEFGPRALGNRSLLADPRGAGVRDRVNEIKQRQMFRPFAPVILMEKANQYFDMPTYSSPYMQHVSKCRYPKDFPGIIHADGTSRVQTVHRHQNPGLYALLQRWYKETGCPMLLNTSLNIRGKPMVNTKEDAKLFEDTYNVKVF